MTEPVNRPGPGRSTADAAIAAIKKRVAERNEQAHKADRKLREPREREKLAEKRRLDSLGAVEARPPTGCA